MTTSNPTVDPQTPSFVAWIGLDWGDAQHAFRLRDQGGHFEEGSLPNTPEAVLSWCQKLEARFGGQPIALAYESTRNGLVDLFVTQTFFWLYPIHPLTSARFRQAFTPSGAKDDQPDAAVLLEVLLHHPDKLRCWNRADLPTEALARFTEVRRDAVDRRTQVANQLTSLLKKSFPQALPLLGHEVTSPMALDFLERWPDLTSLKLAKPSTLKRFYHQHNLRQPQAVEQRLALIPPARSWTTEEDLMKVARMEVLMLVALLRTYHQHIGQLEQQIAARFAEHPEAYLFRDLPGAGPVLAPRLLAAFGTDRDRYAAAESLQKAAGVAPVREKSGQRLWTHWRWLAPRFLRQTFVEWAGQTVVHCPWAKAYYRAMAAKGKSHHVILRALAFKWIRVLWVCWKNRTPYDEAKYLRQLKLRQSSYAAA